MIEQDEKLLLMDLCARIPYGVMCEVDYCDDPVVLEGIPNTDTFLFCNGVIERYASQIKPYLRKISSITEEEERELNGLLPEVYDFSFRMDELLELIQTQNEIPFRYIDWLNRNHFDYRGLIEKELALEAPEGMYNTRTKEN